MNKEAKIPSIGKVLTEIHNKIILKALSLTNKVHLNPYLQECFNLSCLISLFNN